MKFGLRTKFFLPVFCAAALCLLFAFGIGMLAEAVPDEGTLYVPIRTLYSTGATCFGLALLLCSAGLYFGLTPLARYLRYLAGYADAVLTEIAAFSIRARSEGTANPQRDTANLQDTASGAEPGRCPDVQGTAGEAGPQGATDFSDAADLHETLAASFRCSRPLEMTRGDELDAVAAALWRVENRLRAALIVEWKSRAEVEERAAEALRARQAAAEAREAAEAARVGEETARVTAVEALRDVDRAERRAERESKDAKAALAALPDLTRSISEALDRLHRLHALFVEAVQRQMEQKQTVEKARALPAFNCALEELRKNMRSISVVTEKSAARAGAGAQATCALHDAVAGIEAYLREAGKGMEAVTDMAGGMTESADRIGVAVTHINRLLTNARIKALRSGENNEYLLFICNEIQKITGEIGAATKEIVAGAGALPLELRTVFKQPKVESAAEKVVFLAEKTARTFASLQNDSLSIDRFLAAGKEAGDAQAFAVSAQAEDLETLRNDTELSLAAVQRVASEAEALEAVLLRLETMIAEATPQRSEDEDASPDSGKAPSLKLHTGRSLVMPCKSGTA